jgi:glycosyltransferase involved in cell wall biosynthesis
MTTAVFVARTRQDVELLAPAIVNARERADGRVVCVGLDHEAREAFQQAGVPCENTIAYFSPAQHRSVLVEAARFARQCFKVSDLEQTLRYKHVTIQEMMEKDVAKLFHTLLSDLEIFIGIVELKRPSQVHVVRPVERQCDGVFLTARERYDWELLEALAERYQFTLTAVPKAAPARTVPALESDRMFVEGVNPPSRVRRGVARAWESLALLGGGGLMSVVFFIKECALYWVGKRSVARFRSVPRRVVFLYGIRCGHAIYREMRRSGRAAALVVGVHGPSRVLFPGVPYVNLWSYDDPALATAGEAVGRAFRAAWDSPELQQAFRGLFRYHGLSFFSAVRPRLAYYFCEYLPRMVHEIMLFERFIEAVRPHLVVSVADRNALTIGWMKLAERAGVPSLVLQLGIGPAEADDLFDRTLSFEYLPGVATKRAMWGPRDVEWFARRGVLRDLLALVGAPDIDEFMQQAKRLNKRRICAHLNIDPTRKIVLFCLRNANRGRTYAFYEQTHDELLADVQAALEAIEGDGNLHLVIKAHPGDDQSEVLARMVAAARLKNVSFFKHIEVKYLICIAAVVMVHHSTTALEAMLFGKPILQFKTTGRPARLAYGRRDLALEVNRKEDLVAGIYRLLEDRELLERLDRGSRVFVEASFYGMDGRAAARTITLMEEMMTAAARQAGTTSPVTAAKPLGGRERLLLETVGYGSDDTMRGAQPSRRARGDVS